MNRSGFKRAPYERTRTVHTPIPAHLRRASSFARADHMAQPVEKDNPQRSEAYRRLVAAMPCASCGKVGQSQHAHTNHGKAKAMKNDDRDAMPLCADAPGEQGCHSRFDRYALFSTREEHIAAGKAWAAQTRKQIETQGLWPRNLEKWSSA